MEENSLRGFLEKLEKAGQLVHYTDEVMPEPDIRRICRAALDIAAGNTGPAVLLENIKGYKGKRLVVNVLGTWANNAVMLGMDKDTPLKDQFFEFVKRWAGGSDGELQWVKEAPCQEVKITKDINLYEILPLFRINKYDGGFYLSKASIVTRDPEDPDSVDKQNVGIYRVQIQGPDTLGIQVLPFHDGGIHLRKAEEMGKALPVAICLGVHPVVSLMASAPLQYDQSEYKYAASFMGAPLVLAKALTSGLDVPAYTEVVLEGEFVPRQRFVEGPFGEFPGSYSGSQRQFRIKLNTVTTRKDPIFENLYIGRPWTENDTLLGLNTSTTLYFQLRETMPEVKAVNAIYQHGLTVIVATDNRFGGYAKTVAMRLASTPHGTNYAKNIILVDGDVDPFNLVQVMWALSTRVRPQKDVIIIPNTPGMPLDPCSEPPGMGGKLIIDATTPAAPETAREVRMVERMPEADPYQKILLDLQKAAR
ncbi:non-oxidative hydroxyarylic acid decarboxylases subunit C [Pelotomaculum propionicicum]|uniref:non-oxidative hydroxyarylic acid decarboxylases subunit C n=1 Tax=Pelotomaculum propionicicum TaxID=258475 RepID=UPI003B7F6B6C